MKISPKQIIAVAIATVVCLTISPQINAATVPASQEVTQDEGLIFNWKNAPWPDVVEWFAGQAGFVLEPVDQYPDGSFSLVSDRALSPVEAIDEINHRLRLSTPSKMLLRNGSRLFLVDADTELPAELVETIDVSELENRGKYEPLQVTFDVSGMNLDDIEKQLRQRIQSYNEDFFQVYPDTMEIFVRESGENLRFMRDLISRAKASGTQIYASLILKHISAELFLQQLSGFHDLDEEYRNPDRTLKLTIDSAPGSQRILMRGTPAKIRDVESALGVIDVEPAKAEESPDDPTRLRQYLVPRDSKETYEVIDRLLFDAGNGARVIQGSETGKITVRGKASDHAIVAEVLGLQTGNGGFTTVQLENGDAGDILIAAETVLGITAENVADKVKMLANTDRDFIMLRGTPSQVTDAREIIEELDRKSAPVTGGLRTRRRVISMAPDDVARILPGLKDMWPTMGRENLFDVRPPRRALDADSLFRQREQEKAGERNQGSMKKQGSVLRTRMFQFMASVAPATALQLSASMLQSPDEPSPGDLKQEKPGAYALPKQIESVPGAPVTVWATEYGIIIESDDLDAADDAEYLIDSMLGEESEGTKPTIYQLAHCEAGYMKSLLESMFGLSSGGGGGGGLLSGIADNVMGEAGGGMVDSLFGGGLGGDTASATLEGDVKIGVDGRLNYLWVTGATTTDLAQIDSFVELFDVSTPAHNPETAGQIYAIQIRHRDPEEIKTHVERMMSQYFEDPEMKGGGGGGGDAANMMKMMRTLAGGGGGGGAEVEEVKPRGTLSVDMKTSQLLFMGPKFMFIQVEALVAIIDQPEIKVPLMMKQIPLEGEDGEKLAMKIKILLGEDKIEILGSDMLPKSEGGTMGKEGAAGSDSKNAEAAKATQAAQQKQAQQAQQAQARFIQALQQRQRGQNNNRPNRGGPNRGGPNRGGR